MCITAHRARLTNTILYGGLAEHQGDLVHVTGYQNTVANQHTGPNMMILPVPAEPGSMTPENFLDTERTPGVLQDMVTALRLSGGGSKGLSFSRSIGSAPPMQVFNHGIYTVAMGYEVTEAALQEALARVPAQKRPTPNWEVLLSFPENFPGETLLYLCFDNAEAAKATPLMYWYKPMTAGSTRVFLPALDGHDGRAPQPGKMVGVDHTIIVGEMRSGGVPVRYQGDVEPLRPFLPERVLGCDLSNTWLPNGDFVVDLDPNARGSRMIERTHSSERFAAYSDLD